MATTILKCLPVSLGRLFETETGGAGVVGTQRAAGSFLENSWRRRLFPLGFALGLWFCEAPGVSAADRPVAAGAASRPARKCAVDVCLYELSALTMLATIEKALMLCTNSYFSQSASTSIFFSMASTIGGASLAHWVISAITAKPAVIASVTGIAGISAAIGGFLASKKKSFVKLIEEREDAIAYADFLALASLYSKFTGKVSSWWEYYACTPYFLLSDQAKAGASAFAATYLLGRIFAPKFFGIYKLILASAAVGYSAWSIMPSVTKILEPYRRHAEDE